MRRILCEPLVALALMGLLTTACGEDSTGGQKLAGDSGTGVLPDAEGEVDDGVADAQAETPDAEVEPTRDAAVSPEDAEVETDLDPSGEKDVSVEEDAAPVEDAELPPDVPPPPPDLDGDGFDATVDCDDENDEVYPGAPEVENGIDDDCDGYTDEIAVCNDGVAAYGTIQGAVDGAPLGSVVEICPGIWMENVRMTRAITLRGGGENRDDVVIDGGGLGATIVIAGGEVDEIALNNLQIRGGQSNEGGGVRCESGLLMMTGTRVTANSATQGAGIFVRNCQILISANDIDANTATENGGGIHLASARGEVGDNRIFENFARRGGGVAVNEGEAVVRGNEIRANRATDADLPGTALGGGIWHNSNALLDGNTISENDSDFNGGGLWVTDNRSGTISNNTFEGNHCYGDGGGIYLSRSAQGVFEGNRVVRNRADDDGGGLRVFTSRAIVRNNEFIGNEAADDGGGVKVSHNQSLIEDNVVEENSAGDKGGGIELDNDHSLVQRVVIRNNFAAYGGGIHCSTAHQGHQIFDVRIEGNIAAQCGGGAYFNDEAYPLETFRAEFINNSAARGGALCALNMANYSFTNTLFVGNRADQTGGAVHSENSNAVFDYATIADSAAEDGSALYLLGGRFTGSSNIVYRSQFGAAISTSGASVTWQYSNVFDSDNLPFNGMPDPTGDAGNLADDPNFADPDQRDYQLVAPSVCIDAGDPSRLDRDGSRSDMGAYGGPEAP